MEISKLPNNMIKTIIVKGILLRTRNKTHNPSIKKRAENAYLSIFGKKMPTRDISPIPVSLFGPAGNGKTSLIKDASKIASEAMGLNFVDLAEHPTYSNKDGDFVYSSIGLSGQTSPLVITGIPSIEKQEDGRTFTSSAGNKTFNIMQKADAGLIVFDDVGNAHLKVIVALLEVLQFNKYGEQSCGEHISICTSSNLPKDGSAGVVPNFGTPFMTRVMSFMVSDDQESWVSRTLNHLDLDSYERHERELILFFLSTVKDMPDDIFHETPLNNSAHCNSRTLSVLVDYLIDFVEDSGLNSFNKEVSKQDLKSISEGSSMGPISTFKSFCHSIVGNKAADYFSYQITAYLRGAKPLSDKLITAIKSGDKTNLKNILDDVKDKIGSVMNIKELDFGKKFIDSSILTLTLDFKEEINKHKDAIKKNSSDEKILEEYLASNTKIYDIFYTFAYPLSVLSPYMQGTEVKSFRDNILKVIPKDLGLTFESKISGEHSIDVPLAKIILKGMADASNTEKSLSGAGLIKISREELVSSVVREVNEEYSF